MKYYELYKTASIFKNGLAILDVSPNLTDEEIREIDKIIGYKTVFSLDNPSIQEIKEKYPRNYAFYQLKSFPNRKILFLSNYTGMGNHTPDRPGNYFSHVIIFEEKNINFSFRNFLNSFEWKEILTLEEDKNYKPLLGTKEIEIIDFESVFRDDFIHFYNFLSKNNRLPFFSKIIDYIFTFKILEKGQNITIIDSKGNLIDWVLCVNYFLPNDLAEQITFASYIGSPKESPFKLTAIIPECNIPSNDDYFTIFDSRQETIYEPKHLYTKKIFDFIKGNNLSNWLSFVNEITNINYLKLNEFLTKFNFIEGIGNNSSISEYIEKCFSLTLNEKKEIWSKAYNSDINLYNEIVIFELNNKIDSVINIEGYKKLFSDIYEEFVVNKEEYRLLYLDGLIDIFLSKIPIHNNTKILSSYILLNSNCNTNEKKQLRILLQKIDTDYISYYDNEVKENIETITELDKQYNINLLNFEIPNIKKIMKFKEIIQEAKKDYFINEIRKHNNFLQNASVKEKRKLFLLAFNNDKYFLKKNFKNFSNYIELINKYLNDNFSIFWADFFDDNRNFEKNKDYTYHSLGYLKKRFVADIFLSEYNLKILEKMDFTNEYTMKWINEAVTEETDREAILDRFSEHFKNNRHINNRSSLLSSFNLFKK